MVFSTPDDTNNRNCVGALTIFFTSMLRFVKSMVQSFDASSSRTPQTRNCNSITYSIVLALVPQLVDHVGQLPPFSTSDKQSGS